MSDTLTDKQIDVLAEYEAAWLAARPMPSLAELGRIFGLSREGIHARIRALARKGWLVLPGQGGTDSRVTLTPKAIRHLESHAGAG